MRYVLVVKCTDGSTRKIEQEADTAAEAQAQAHTHLAYYQGVCIDEVLGIAEAVPVPA